MSKLLCIILVGSTVVGLHKKLIQYKPRLSAILGLLLLA